MRQGVARPETPRDRREREALEEDLLENPLAGEPLRQLLRNFRPDAGAQLTALGGPLAWMRRLRAIEIEAGLHEQQLGAAFAALREECGSDADCTDIADDDGNAAGGGQHDVLDIGDIVNPSDAADHHGLLVGIELCAAGIAVVRTKRVVNLFHGEAEFLERVWRELDLILFDQPAEGHDVGDAGNLKKARADDPVL